MSNRQISGEGIVGSQIATIVQLVVARPVLAGGASIASLEQVVETWTSVYYIAGTVSLFAHVMSRSTAVTHAARLPGKSTTAL